MDKVEERKEKARIRARKWHWENRERAIKKAQQRYQKDPRGHYEKKRNQLLNDPEAHRAYKDYLVDYARRNSARAVERASAWRKANPDKVKLANAKRKAQKLGSQVGPIDYQAIKDKGMHCGICDYRIEGDYQYDHIIPLAAGGGHVQDNLQLAHPICNVRKKSNANYVPSSVLKKTPKGLI